MTRHLQFAAAALILLSRPAGAGVNVSDFANPPKEYRPQVWWHWMNGKDLGLVWKKTFRRSTKRDWKALYA